jgi:hypothetical protein
VHFLQPAIMAAAPVALPRGRAFTLRYRIAAFDGDVPVGVLNRLSTEWRR